ncbi:Uncharacterised protein [uncultured archaeon]|nr:Uncharacterised protein [uncultured archaeon]
MDSIELEIAREICHVPDSCSVDFKDYSSLRATLKKRGGGYYFTVAKEFKNTDISVQIGLYCHLFEKLFGKKFSEADSYVKVYKKFIKSQKAELITDHLARLNGRDVLIDKGKFHNLDRLLNQVCTAYSISFNGLVSYSKEKSFRRLGFYDSARNRIVISKSLDDERVPPYVVEFVLYHELLHSIIDVEFKAKRIVHSKRFKEAEDKFKYKKESDEWINRNLSKLKRRSLFGF